MSLKKTDLHEYQKRAVDWLVSRERGFVWLGMGDGKTVIAATAIAELRQPTILVGTKRIVQHTWPEELSKWDHLNKLTYAAAVGAKRKRETAVAENPDILGVSYENLQWLLTNGLARGRTLLVFDEISKMKSHSTRRFRALSLAYRHAKTMPRVFGLTATPALEGHGGLWSQWKSVGGDDRLGRNITEFRNLFTTPVYKGNFTDYVIPKGKAAQIEELLSPDIYTIADNERPYEQKALVEDVAVPWGSTGASNTYGRMEKDLIAELASGTFTAASKGVALNKCRQLAAGFIYDEERNVHVIDEDKFDAIAEAVEELQGEPCLVFYQFIPEKEELMRRIPSLRPLGDDEIARDAQIILHPKSAGHGLNLQDKIRYAFFSSCPWSGEEYVQSIGRVDRQGQTRQPIVKRFVRSGTIDVDVIAAAEGKIDDEQELLRRVVSRQQP